MEDIEEEDLEVEDLEEQDLEAEDVMHSLILNANNDLFTAAALKQRALTFRTFKLRCCCCWPLIGRRSVTGVKCIYLGLCNKFRFHDVVPSTSADRQAVKTSEILTLSPEKNFNFCLCLQ